MKKSIIISFVALCAILFSSCGSLSISQKRYSRGFNIDWFNKKDDVPKQSGVKIKSKENQLSVAELSTENVQSNVVVSNIQETFSSDNSTRSVINIEKKTGQTAKRNVKSRPVQKFKQIKTQIKTLTHKQPIVSSKTNSINETNESDVDMLILVLLALFLPPLAIFLYFGEIETHFWINILLIILGVGFWFSSGAFGWIGLAIVHALLVIFGIFG